MKIFSGVPNINFMAQRKLGLIISAALTVLSIALVLVRGLNLGIDFTGGVLVEVGYPQAVQLDIVREQLHEGGYERAVVQHFGSASSVMIRLPPAENASSAQVSSQILHALAVGAEKAPELRRIEFVGPQIGDELTQKGSLALLFAFVGIALYIAFRFEGKFALGAIAALVHDVVMAVGFLSLFWVEFDITTLAAILALIGYSNNETIVIFDRIRENLIAERRSSVLDVVNLSVNQTLLRSVITHFTTLLVLTALFTLGGQSVHSFSVALIVGVIVATYSSIYVSTNLAVALGVSREDLLPPAEKEIDEMP
ncbi:protein translocase subunit SecF [Solimonas sp. K1W22B-7]|uniref:protein translocase subunit SecF n=1 Tax=Solimonas sp. K1W22B-7 TaxID=2303331 RepID=UPI000E33254D|nr:protein translocase subunit SecF [Solimonas sp. K1W22B-7]AXQ29922.1 protein translocase subunit SecF [Solimonas sp. K1W22B-7]